MDVLILRRATGFVGVAVASGVVALATPGCKPDLEQRASRISGTRVLAVRAEPAEAEPRDSTDFTALVVGADGTVDAAPIPSWAFCTARKPLAELGPVSPACFEGGSGAFVALGGGRRVAGAIPASACRDFGPEVPQARPGEAYGRPADPDPTGGYYQPLTLFVGAGEVAVETTRIACGVAGASSDDVIAFRQRYHANENPRLDELRVADVAVAPDSVTPVGVARGARVTFHVAWPQCPAVDRCGDGICGPDETRAACPADCAKPVGCQGAERYTYFDADGRQLVVRRESMRVSWFASAGTFERDRTGRSTEDAEPSSDNEWDAPAEAGTVHGWVVLRDDRAGVAWRGFALEVR